MKATIIWQKEALDWPYKLTVLEFDPLKTALLIVDISNHSSDPIDQILPNIFKLREFFRQQNLKVLYCLVGAFLPDGRDQHIKRRLTWHRKSEDEPAKIYPRGSFEHEIRECLKPVLPNELVIDKNTGSAFNSSAINHYLQSMDVQNLVICGMVTSRCVENTARDTADLGYNVILVDDACGDSIPENHQATMHTFARVLGSIKSTDEIIAELSGILAKEPAILQEVAK